MTVVVVFKWLVKPEKQAAHDRMMQRYVKWMKENPTAELRSYRILTQMFGGIYGSYIELMEFDNIADFEKVFERNMKDKEFAAIMQETVQVTEPATLCFEVWNAVI